MSFNAELISTFNKLNLRQTLSLQDMVPAEEYHITGAERINTKYGETILLQLGSNVLYLPRRFNSLSDKDVENLSTGAFIILKLPLNDGKDSSVCRLELKPVPPMRDYYPFSTFK